MLSLLHSAKTHFFLNMLQPSRSLWLIGIIFLSFELKHVLTAICNSYQFSCGWLATSRCISLSSVCDGHCDCDDEIFCLDEENCSHSPLILSQRTAPPAVTSKPAAGACFPSCLEISSIRPVPKCLMAPYRCNGQVDCVRGNDESMCNETAARGTLNITTTPMVLKFGETTTTLLRFDPPCPDVVVYRGGRFLANCIFGPDVFCKKETLFGFGVPRLIDNGTLEIRSQSANSSGLYYALCQEPFVTYDTDIPDGVSNVKIYEKSSVIYATWSYTGGYHSHYTAQNLTRSLNGSDVIFSTTINFSLVRNSAVVTFYFNRGFHPDNLSSMWPLLMTAKDSQTASVLQEMNNMWYQASSLSSRAYTFNLSALALIKVCRLEGTLAVKMSPVPTSLLFEPDQASFRINVVFDNPVISRISVNRSSDGNSCGCLFTCHVFTCGSSSYKLEWTLGGGGGNLTTFTQQSQAGNTLFFNSTACRELFSKASLDQSYFISCKATSPGNEAAVWTAQLQDLLRPCSVDDIQCDATCFSKFKKCNERRDCLDGSDEIGCPASCPYGIRNSYPYSYGYSYSTPRWLCRISGECISSSSRCDSKKDCIDGTDEYGCISTSFSIYNVPCVPENNETTFKCDNYQCIPRAKMCDGVSHCIDGSDEKQLLCLACDQSQGLWKCKSTSKCLRKSQVCDGVIDCGPNDASDESSNECIAKFVLTQSCPAGTINCRSNNLCVPQTKACDGLADCCIAEIRLSLRQNNTHVGECEMTDELACFVSSTGCDTEICQKEDCIALNRVIDFNSEFCPSKSEIGDSGPGFYCSCKSGFRFNQDLSNLQRCVDVDECTSVNVCTQKCLNTDGSYECQCVEGFTRENLAEGYSGNPALTHCSVNYSISETLVILFSYDDTIRALTPANGKERIIAHVGRTDYPMNFDVDIRDGTIIYAGDGGVFRTSLPVNSKQPPSTRLSMISTIGGYISDFAIDFITKNLYFAEFTVSGVQLTKRSRISVSLIDGRYQKTLVNLLGIRVSSIAVNPLLGRLYYSAVTGEGLESHSELRMAAMNGDSRLEEVIFRSPGVSAITSLTIDYLAGGRFYFLSNTGDLMLCNIDCSKRIVLIKADSSLKMASMSYRHLDIFESALYGAFDIAAMRSSNGVAPIFPTSRIFKTDKLNRMPISFIGGTRAPVVTTLRIYHPWKAGVPSTWPDPCRTLGCTHLCLLEWSDFGDKASCACPEHATSSMVNGKLNCQAKLIPALKHPAHCIQDCVEGQGICIYDEQLEYDNCTCFPGYFGEFCNETQIQLQEKQGSKPPESPSPIVLHEKLLSVVYVLIACTIVLSCCLLAAAGVILWRRGCLFRCIPRSNTLSEENRRVQTQATSQSMNELLASSNDDFD